MTSSEDNLYPIKDVLNYTYLGIISTSPLYSKTDIAINFVYKINKEARNYVIVSDAKDVIEYDISQKYNELQTDKLILLDYYEFFTSYVDYTNSVIVIDDISRFIQYIECASENLESCQVDSIMDNPRLSGEKIVDENKKKDFLAGFYTIINENNNYLLMITDFRTDVKDVKFITLDTKEFNSPLYLTFPQFFSCKKDMKIYKVPKFVYHPVKLTKLQEMYLKDNAKSIELDKDIPINLFINSDEFNKFIKEQQPIFNILYPKRIQDLISQSPYDIPPVEEVVSYYGIDKLLENAPKLRSLYDNIKRKNDERHLIYINTRYWFEDVDDTEIVTKLKNFGFDLIKYLFINPSPGSKNVEYNVFNEDTTSNFLYISELQDLETRSAIIQKFNEKDIDGKYKFKILLTDAYIDSSFGNEMVKDVKNLHMIDCIDFKDIGEFIIDSLFKLNNYMDMNYELNVHVYYSLDSFNKNTIEYDITNYFIKKLDDRFAFLRKRCEKGYEIEGEIGTSIDADYQLKFFIEDDKSKK